MEPLHLELMDRLQQYGQQHLVRWWDELGGQQRRSLAAQIESVDFEAVEAVLKARRATDADQYRIDQIQPAAQVVRLPKRPGEHEAWAAAARTGQQALVDGKVGAILVAGGQGTRLGFDSPKGMLPVGPVSGATLFQILAEQLLARSRRAGHVIPYYVMTSDATHDETLAFFHQHHFFGLKADDVRFFRQGKMPAVDKNNARLLLADKGSLAMSPDGHGGMLEALHRSGCLADMNHRGIECLYYHQVDNPTAIVCDPAFIGFHILRQSEMSTKVVAKRDASEKMGVVVEADGKTQIVEYISMPSALTNQTDANGNLLHWAGNMAIHVFDREFLDRLIRENIRLPLHPSEKMVPFLDDEGIEISPGEPNACKFERFIFDALPHAWKALVVEADRAREFNPVKNAEGSDTPASARAAMSAVFRSWLRAAGAAVPEGTPVDISPLFALDENDVKHKIQPGRRFAGPILLK